MMFVEEPFLSQPFIKETRKIWSFCLFNENLNMGCQTAVRGIHTKKVPHSLENNYMCTV